jgi:hypothetical protein
VRKPSSFGLIVLVFGNPGDMTSGLFSGALLPSLAVAVLLVFAFDMLSTVLGNRLSYRQTSRPG